MFSIEMLPAGHGDCLFITYGEAPNPHYVLIDGGPYYAFKQLVQRIDQWADSEQTFELFVITHVDADHIDGAIKLLGAESLVTFQDVWFNAWDHLPEVPDELGPPHGEMLTARIEKRALPWNSAFDNKPVVVTKDEPLPTKTLPGGLRLTLLSPTGKELYDLRGVWEREVRKAGLEPGSREQALRKLADSARLRTPDDMLGGSKTPDVDALAQYPFESDDTEANGSSIALLAEYEGKRCLFAGDAHPAVLESSIQALIALTGKDKLSVDAFKLPHHGSHKNVSESLLTLLDCQRFLISTNGSYYNHPSPEAIARIIKYGGKNVNLIFNYRSEETEIWDNDKLQWQYNYCAYYPEPYSAGYCVEL